MLLFLLMGAAHEPPGDERQEENGDNGNDNGALVGLTYGVVLLL